MSTAEPRTLYDVWKPPDQRMQLEAQYAARLMPQAAAHQTGGAAPGAEVQSGS